MRLNELGEMTTMAAWLADTRHWLASSLAALLLGIAIILASRSPAAAVSGVLIAAPRSGLAAPDFTLERLGGGEIHLAELRGHIVVINLWATWCPPCRAEMADLNQVYMAEKDKGVIVLGVNVTDQDSEPAAAAFAGDNRLEFPILLDRRGEISRLYLLQSLPSTFFVDRQGIIRKVIIGGPMSRAAITSAIADLQGGGQ
jgi:cytochrome c biogenesis protein CcmG/thiol:disulfide interchange protein DsbE